MFAVLSVYSTNECRTIWSCPSGFTEAGCSGFVPPTNVLEETIVVGTKRQATSSEEQSLPTKVSRILGRKNMNEHVQTGNGKILHDAVKRLRKKCKMHQRKISSLKKRLEETKKFARSNEQMLSEVTKEGRLMIEMQFRESSKAPQVLCFFIYTYLQNNENNESNFVWDLDWGKFELYIQTQTPANSRGIQKCVCMSVCY